jgi:hypothetical protein
VKQTLPHHRRLLIVWCQHLPSFNFPFKTNIILFSILSRPPEVPIMAALSRSGYAGELSPLYETETRYVVKSSGSFLSGVFAPDFALSIEDVPDSLCMAVCYRRQGLTYRQRALAKTSFIHRRLQPDLGTVGCEVNRFGTQNSFWVNQFRIRHNTSIFNNIPH